MPQVEFLGLARRYAGVESLSCAGATLEELLLDISARCPGFAGRCPPDSLLPSGLIVCINERRFTTDLGESVGPDDRVLILSADVGG